EPAMLSRKAWSGVNLRSRMSIQVLTIALLATSAGYAQVAPGSGQVSTPESSAKKPGDTGVRAHNNIQIFSPNRGARSAPPPARGVISRPAPSPGARVPSDPVRAQ